MGIFGCSNNCFAPNVTIFTKMQFSWKCINIFTIIFSIYFWCINHTIITNFWHNREKLRWFFLCCKENGPWNPLTLCTKVYCPVAPPELLNFFSYFAGMILLPKWTKWRGVPLKNTKFILVNHPSSHKVAALGRWMTASIGPNRKFILNQYCSILRYS